MKFKFRNNLETVSGWCPNVRGQMRSILAFGVTSNNRYVVLKGPEWVQLFRRSDTHSPIAL